MANKISDKDVLQLFTGLKTAEENYPQDMIKSRRDKFAMQASTMALLIKSGGNGAASTGAGQGTAASSATSTGTTGLGVSIGTVLETALVIAIAVEAGVAAYAYRNNIADFFNSTFSPKVEQITNPTDGSSPALTAGDDTQTETPDPTSTATPVTTVTETATPPGFIDPTPPSDNNGDSQVASTPAPTDNNGLHLGQTKQPTKQPKNNDSNNEPKDKKK
jgi:hypothetical protein